MWPEEDLAGRLASPDIPGLLARDPDLWRAVRRSGGAIAPNGDPLTTSGWQRIRRWRQDWLGLPSQVIPAVVGHDQILRSGTEGLRYLTGRAGGASVSPHLPARAEPDPDTRPERPATGWAA